MRLFVVALSLLAAMPAQAAESIKPGRWQNTSVADALAMPGMPPEVAARMQAKPTTITHCITEAQAKDNPRALFEASKGTCTYSKFQMADGKIDTVAVCNQQGSTMTVSSKGTYTPTSFSVRSTMVGSGKSAGMSMKFSATGKWIGACGKS